MKTIILAGGCFWGVEAYFKQLDGVSNTKVGYIGEDFKPTYEQVCNGSGHAEAVVIEFDEEVISLKKILDHFFNIIDPTSINKQGNDKGVQYRTGIYNYQPEDLPFIKSYLQVKQNDYDNPLQIELKTNLPFFKAEDEHQDYLDKNKNGYCHVNLASYKQIDNE
ncbi:MAG: peptide-methionine (S)-S-oxide reductase MsrA [Candidatus Izimaplasma sp.]|nr:peptide-methionine (S)-S-oxide reductase MsrA [Candidatus Izimaplasma bacterium]